MPEHLRVRYLQQLTRIPSVVDMFVQAALEEITEFWGPSGQKDFGGEQKNMWIHYLKPSAQNVFLHVAHQRDGCIRVGGSDFAILSKTLIGFISWLGGSICASSIKVIPRDQMSALESYGRSLDVSHITTSGAILEGNNGKDPVKRHLPGNN